MTFHLDQVSVVLNYSPHFLVYFLVHIKNVKTELCQHSNDSNFTSVSLDVALVSYCCITNYCKLSGLTPPVYYLSLEGQKSERSLTDYYQGVSRSVCVPLEALRKDFFLAFCSF